MARRARGVRRGTHAGSAPATRSRRRCVVPRDADAPARAAPAPVRPDQLERRRSSQPPRPASSSTTAPPAMARAGRRAVVGRLRSSRPLRVADLRRRGRLVGRGRAGHRASRSTGPRWSWWTTWTCDSASPTPSASPAWWSSASWSSSFAGCTPCPNSGADRARLVRARLRGHRLLLLVRLRALSVAARLLHRDVVLGARRRVRVDRDAAGRRALGVRARGRHEGGREARAGREGERRIRVQVRASAVAPRSAASARRPAVSRIQREGAGVVALRLRRSVGDARRGRRAAST